MQLNLTMRENKKVVRGLMDGVTSFYYPHKYGCNMPNMAVQFHLPVLLPRSGERTSSKIIVSTQRTTKSQRTICFAHAPNDGRKRGTEKIGRRRRKKSVRCFYK